MGKALGWIDSHCHLTCADLIGEAQDVRQRALDAGVARMMIVCCRLEEAEAALKMKAEDARFDVAVGFHPSDLRDFTEEDWHKLETLVYNENVTAIGEIGLDYYWLKTPEERANSRDFFDAQLSLAIGKEGQNARLAAKLTGWKIDIKPASAPADEEPEDEEDVLLDDEAETEE